MWVASPKPTPITLAAAYVAGADALLAVGGAQVYFRKSSYARKTLTMSRLSLHSLMVLVRFQSATLSWDLETSS